MWQISATLNLIKFCLFHMGFCQRCEILCSSDYKGCLSFGKALLVMQVTAVCILKGVGIPPGFKFGEKRVLKAIALTLEL